MNIAIILLAFTTIINALHISYIYKELSKRFDRERKLTTKYVDLSIDEIKYTNDKEMQKLINDIKSGKLKKETNKKKED